MAHEVNQGTILAQQYHVNKGLKVFGDRGKDAVTKVMTQLNDMKVVKPHHMKELTAEQKKYALPCLMFLTEKRDSSVKARMCVDVSKQEMDKKKCLHLQYLQTHCSSH